MEDARDLAFSSVCFDFMRRFDPSVLPSGNWPNRSIRLPGRVLNKLWSFFPFPSYNLLAGSGDLFHFPNFTLPPVSGCAKTVITVHDAAFMRLPETIEPKNLAYLRRTLPDSLRRADRIIAVSEFTKRELVDCFNVKPDKICVTLEGVESRFFEKVSDAKLQAFRRQRKLPEKFILTVGTIEPRKNLINLFRAFKRLADEGRDELSLVVAGGRGWLYEDIFREVETLGLRDRIHFIGYVSDDELPYLYRCAEIFSFVSLYEGFGLPPLEAMASGVPVVVSDAPALCEVGADAVLNAPAGEPEEIAARFSSVLDDKTLKNDMIDAGLKRAAFFTWDETARATARVYRQTL